MKHNATTSTCWVYTEAGYQQSLNSPYLGPDDLQRRLPGLPVPTHYRQTCPASWVRNGWIEEQRGQLSLF